MRQFGIIGYPLSHSFSPDYFNKKFEREKLNCQFDAFPIRSIGEFEMLIDTHKNLCGLSVTIPYKTIIIKHLDAISLSAKSINAVNCIKIENGITIGFNTDYLGFQISLKPLLVPEIKRALVLGTGGASKAICFALQQLGIEYNLVSRSDKKFLCYHQLDQKIIENHQLIINTTPLGMYPNEGECPDIPYQFLNQYHLLFDLIYNPDETLFLKKVIEQNARFKNGLEMLHLQAEEAWQIWNTDDFEEEIIRLK